MPAGARGAGAASSAKRLLSPANFLSQHLPSIKYHSDATPARSQYPSPTRGFEVWDLDFGHVLEDLDAALKACSPSSRLSALRARGAQSEIMSEAGIKSALDGPLLGVSDVLRISGVDDYCRWVQEVPAGATTARRGKKASQPMPSDALGVVVRGHLGKRRPDFELLDGSNCSCSFIEVKPPYVHCSASWTTIYLPPACVPARDGQEDHGWTRAEAHQPRGTFIPCRDWLEGVKNASLAGLGFRSTRSPGQRKAEDAKLTPGAITESLLSQVRIGRGRIVHREPLRRGSINMLLDAGIDPGFIPPYFPHMHPSP